MKAMKQLLIVIGLMSMLSLNAQMFVEKPYAQMRSTSAMKGISSTLPQAAITGAQTTYDSNSFYGAKTPSGGPKKGAANDDNPPTDPPGPNEYPLGDTPWLLIILLALGYALHVGKKHTTRIPATDRQKK
jgi:hypothetical protein